jgi:dienelactone hydrolase
MALENLTSVKSLCLERPEPSTEYLYRSMAEACISREFYTFSSDKTSPIGDWLKALAAYAFPISGGLGVGAIGMCFTGNFALSMLLEKSVIAPVLCQPSLPISQKEGMHISPEDLEVLAYRFAGDSFCRAERFTDYEGALGDKFKGTLFPDSAAAESDSPPHSVVTMHLIDEDGEPTRAAIDEILSLYTRRLKEV